LHVVESLGIDKIPSTKVAGEFLAKVAPGRNVLVVLQREDDLTLKSVRNLENVHVLSWDQLNAYDVLVSDDIVFTKEAFEAFAAGPAAGKSVKAAASSKEVSA
jgi:large subunit ribosomal protein L4